LNTQRLLSTEITNSIRTTEANITARLSAQDAQLNKGAQQHELQIAILREEEFNVCKRRLLKALAFPEINERRNMIEGRVNDFGDTYKWIFDEAQDDNLSEVASSEVSQDEIEPTTQKSLPAHSFVDWLRGGKDLFWISGKPGSGKSTLMDYIYHKIQPGATGSSMLEDWAGSHCVAILTFWFFRPASTPLLRTLHGLWRSLCFQILDSDPKLIMTIREDKDGTAPSDLRSCLLPGGSNAESWTDKQLISWFWYMIEHSDMRYCVLIDGLDEIESNRELLLEMVMSMSVKSNKLKLCCASRPENPFRTSLKHCPNLQLQDFNRGDIEEDCRTRLEGTRAEKFADQIAERAEGVFLWAHLISRDLARAAKEGENEEDLGMRFRDCPDEMTNLFRYMLQRQDRLYAKNPKPYLQLVDVATTLDLSATLLELLVATLPQARSPKWSEFCGKFDNGFMSYLEEQLDGLGPRIESTCAGLVECLSQNDDDIEDNPLRSDPSHPKLDAASLTIVTLIHRSVHDFLREDEGGAAYCQRFKLTTDDAVKLLVAAAMSPLFLSNEKLIHDQNFLAAPFFCAKGLSTEGFDTKMIAVLDAFVRQLVLRSLPAEEKKKGSYPGLRIVSPDLSPHENVSIGLSSIHQLDVYVQTKILEAEPTRRHALAAHALCSYLQYSEYFTRPRVEMIKGLYPYLDALQVCKIDYVVRYVNSRNFLSTRSLIEHVIAAQLDFQWGHFNSTPDYSQLPPEFFNPCTRSEPEFGCVEGWILFNTNSYILPEMLPWPDHDCAFMKKALKDVPVMVWQALPQDMLQKNFYPVKIVQWSPSGTKRFLRISEAVQQQFRGSHSRRSWANLWQDFGAALLEGLESLSDDVDEEEFEEIKTANRHYFDVYENDQLIFARLYSPLNRLQDLYFGTRPRRPAEDSDGDEDDDSSLPSIEGEMPSPTATLPETNLPLALRRKADENIGHGAEKAW
jgi:hypothetical protein